MHEKCDANIFRARNAYSFDADNFLINNVHTVHTKINICRWYYHFEFIKNEKWEICRERDKMEFIELMPNYGTKNAQLKWERDELDRLVGSYIVAFGVRFKQSL